MFEGKRLLRDVIPLYHTTVAAVVAERETYLSTSSEWDCEMEPAMPMLMALARELPGWYYSVLTPGLSSVSYQLRPVTFDAFSSILGEFLREYDCKLLDMEGQASVAIAQGEDLGSLCTTSPCPELSSGDLGVRIDAYIQFLQGERHRARVALERTLHAMRSFDVQYDAARSLLCYERAALDLRNEMSLLADATSCMPKIWDTVTSLHDRKAKP
jgi:hypothetical protein